MRNNRFCLVITLGAILFSLSLPVPVFPADPPKDSPSPSLTGVRSNIIPFSPSLSASALTGRPDTDRIRFSNGRSISLGDVRRLQAAGQKIRGAAKDSRLPTALRIKPAGSGTPIKNGADLAAAFKRSDNETLQLPNGKLITVGQLKFFQPQIEKKLGNKFAAGAPSSAPTAPALKVATRADLAEVLKRPDNALVQLPSGRIVAAARVKAAVPEIERRIGQKLNVAFQETAPSGPIIKISKNFSKADWTNLLNQPDQTILESPTGKRVTVGKLKAFITSMKSGAGGPGKIGPLDGPKPLAPLTPGTVPKPDAAPGQQRR